MKQFSLAAFLVVAPILVFALGYHLLAPPASVAAEAPALGDLSSLRTIVTDVQSAADGGDLKAAADRVKKLETAWDEAEPKLRPLSETQWVRVDDAIDAVLSALRAETPDATEVKATLAALLPVLDNPGAATAAGVMSVAGIPVTDDAGHPVPCETMLTALRDALVATPSNDAEALLAKATERCNADDDRNADQFSAQALALLKK